MSEEKGILTSDLEKVIRTEVVEILQLKGILKPLASIGLLIGIKQIDDNLGEKIPNEIKLNIRKLLHSVIIDKNYDGSIDDAFAELDKQIDIRFLDDQTEDLLFSGLAQIIKSILALYLKPASTE